jgi:HSP20 family molecular chaperone IbpA
MSKDLIRLMNALFLPGADVCRPSPWQPNVDVYRTAHGWLVKFELAGVHADEIDLQVLGGRMVLRGVRRDTVLEESEKKGESRPVHHRMEIAYSRFERILELPCDLKQAEINTEYRDGLLLVFITPEQKK